MGDVLSFLLMVAAPIGAGLAVMARVEGRKAVDRVSDR